MRITEVKSFNDLAALKNETGIFVYWAHVSVFSKIRQVFGTLVGKAGSVSITPVQNWRQYVSVLKTKEPVYVLANPNFIRTIIVNADAPNAALLVVTEGLNNLTSIPSELEVIKTDVASFLAKNPNDILLVDATSISGFDALNGVSDPRIMFFNNGSQLKQMLDSSAGNAAILFTSDTRGSDRLYYSMLFRPVSKIKFLIPRSNSTSNSTKNAAQASEPIDLSDELMSLFD